MSYNYKILSFIFSFFSSCLLWFYTVNLNKSDLIKNVPINIIPPKGLGVVSELPNFIKFKLSGSKVFLRKLEKEDLLVNLKIDKLVKLDNQKKMTIKLSSNSLNLPFGIDVEAITPKKIDIQFDKLIKKELPLDIKYINLPDKTLKVKMEFNPKKVSVYAGKKLLKKITSIPLKSINLGTLNKSQGTLQVNLSDSIDKRIILPKNFNVYLTYSLYKNEKTLSIDRKKIRFISSFNVYKSSSKHTKIKIKVKDMNISKKKIQKLLNSIQILADVPDFRPGKHKVILRPRSPIELEVLEISPKSIYVYTR
jgi:hypothetical protein